MASEYIEQFLHWKYAPKDKKNLATVGDRGLTIARGSFENIKTGEYDSRYVVYITGTRDGFVLSANELRQLGQTIAALDADGKLVDSLDEASYSAIVAANKRADAQRNKRLW